MESKKFAWKQDKKYIQALMKTVIIGIILDDRKNQHRSENEPR